MNKQKRIFGKAHSEPLQQYNVSVSFNVGDEVELEVYEEECCELCGETKHNHIDCPVCKSNYAGTDQYCDLDDVREVTCEDCGTTFAKISDSWYYDCKAKIVSIGENCH